MLNTYVDSTVRVKESPLSPRQVGLGRASSIEATDFRPECQERE